MGKYDFIHKVMDDCCVKQVFYKVKQRPGKPMYFGIGKQDQNIFGLPGNPVSALICMKRYIITGLEKAMGHQSKLYSAILAKDIHFKKDFSLFAPVNLKCDRQGTITANPIASNGSGDFFSLGKSDGFLELPANKTYFKKGEAFSYFSWPSLSL